MAITPNVSGEQSTKLQIRQNTGGGANVWWTNPAIAQLVNSSDPAQTNTKLFQLVVSGSATTSFTISGSNISASGLTGNSTVSGLVSILTAALPAGYNLTVWAKAGDYLKNTTTDFIISTASGTSVTALAIAVASGVTKPAQITKVDLATTSGAYPNYYATPYAAPTWVDDATVHAYQVVGQGAIVVNSGLVEQKQVRQLQTNFSETQIMDGYYAVYSGSLFQTSQKNTNNQQC